MTCYHTDPEERAKDYLKEMSKAVKMSQAVAFSSPRLGRAEKKVGDFYTFWIPAPIFVVTGPQTKKRKVSGPIRPPGAVDSEGEFDSLSLCLEERPLPIHTLPFGGSGALGH